MDTVEEDRNSLQKHQERCLAVLQELTMMSDLLARNVLKDPDCAAYVLQVILDDPSLRIESLTVQKDYKNLYGRSAVLDCVVKDAAGRLYDVEIQQDNEGAQPTRARYYSALLDMNTLDPGEQFDRLPESYVIFITQGDIPGDGLPIYHIRRMVEETGKHFGDRSHIIYVNASLQEDTELGHLMHDFHCRSAADMYSPVLAGKLRELKESPEGVSVMCTELLQLREEGRAEGRAEGRMEGRAEGRIEGRAEGRMEGREEGEYNRAVAIAGSLLKAGMDHALIAEHTGLPLEEIDRLSA